MSLIQKSQIFKLINPLTIKPIPAPSSPYAAKAHTTKGSSNELASSSVTGNLDSPCCINTMANGILSSQWLRQNSGILFINLCII